jgi:4-hydroxy-tetrahydrodipicolinate synthase
LLVPPPPVGHASPAAIFEYYSSIASSVHLPIVLQDDPVHLGVGLSVTIIRSLSEKFSNCRYAKLEQLPSMSKIREVTEATNGRVSCLGGSGGVYVLEELAAGAIGIMTGFAFPESLVAVYDAWTRGDQGRARFLFRIVSDLARLESLPGVSLAIRKRMYVARGAISSAALRGPADVLDEWTWQLVARELERVETEWSMADG